MMNLMMRLWKDEEGQGMIEYALIAAFISIAAILVFPAARTAVSGIWTKIKDALVEGNAGA